MSDEDEPGQSWALLSLPTGGHAVHKPVDTGDNPSRGTGRIPPRRRTIVVGSTTYVAIEANDLLEYDSIGNYGRPGQPY